MRRNLAIKNSHISALLLSTFLVPVLVGQASAAGVCTPDASGLTYTCSGDHEDGIAFETDENVRETLTVNFEPGSTVKPLDTDPMALYSIMSLKGTGGVIFNAGSDTVFKGVDENDASWSIENVSPNQPSADTSPYIVDFNNSGVMENVSFSVSNRSDVAAAQTTININSLISRSSNVSIATSGVAAEPGQETFSHINISGDIMANPNVSGSSSISLFNDLTAVGDGSTRIVADKVGGVIEGIFTQSYVTDGKTNIYVESAGLVKGLTETAAVEVYNNNTNGSKSDVNVKLTDVDGERDGVRVASRIESLTGEKHDLQVNVAVSGQVTSAANGIDVSNDLQNQSGWNSVGINVLSNNIKSGDVGISVKNVVNNNPDNGNVEIFVHSQGKLEAGDSGIEINAQQANQHVKIDGQVSSERAHAVRMVRGIADNVSAGSEVATQTATLELGTGYELIGAVNSSLQQIIQTESGNEIVDEVYDFANSHLVFSGEGEAGFDLSRIDNREDADYDGDETRLSGFGTLTKNGNSSWLITGANDRDADDAFLTAQINAGTLILDNASFYLRDDVAVADSGIMSVAAQGTLIANGDSFIIGDVVNDGQIYFGKNRTAEAANLNGSLNIDGNYTGNGGLIVFNTVLEGDSSSTNYLHIFGNTAGTSLVTVNNIGGSGAQTVEGIKLIEVDGTSAGTFSLTGGYQHNGVTAIANGAYAYKLFQGGVSTPSDGDWYLRSELIGDKPQYQSGAPVYEIYPQFLLGLSALPTLQQRVGNRYWTGAGNPQLSQGADAIVPYAPAEEAGSFTQGNGVWGRMEGSYTKMQPRVSTSDAAYDYNIFKMQAGVDGLLREGETGKLIGGLTGHYAHGLASVWSPYDSDLGRGRISTDGYGLGATLTWYGDHGFYADNQAQVTWYRSALSYQGGQTALTDGKNNGIGYAISSEIGKRMSLDDHWILTPQAQLRYSNADFDSFTDVFDADVSRERAASLELRLGMSAEYQNAWRNAQGGLNRSSVYGIANLYNEFLNGTQVDVSSVRFTNKSERLWAGIGLGGSYNWNDDMYSIFGEGSVNTSLNHFGDSYSYKGTVGFRVKW